MKTLIGAVFGILLFAIAAVAFDSQYKTRLITSATFTINVRQGVVVTIKNFTQDIDTGQRGIIVAGIVPTTPTPTPTATPTATPVPTPTPTSIDLTATKTDNVGGQTTFSNSWTWNIHVANGGNAGANFTSGQIILSDNLPNANISYGSPQVTISSGVTIAGAINCTIAATDDLTCTASGTVTIDPGGSFDVTITANPSATGTFANPRAGGGCSVDPNNVVPETNKSNNTCADTVVSNAPTPTPTPIFAGILTASIQNGAHAESIKPFIVAGPATLTIKPVPGASLSVTYRKSLQPSGITPTPTPTPVLTRTTTSTSSFVGTASTVGTSATSSGSVVAIASTLTDDDDTYSSTPTPTPVSPSPPPATPSVTPTPSPTPTPSR